MKRLPILLLLWLFGYLAAHSQTVKLLDKQRISITNNSSDYLNFVLINERTGLVIDSAHIYPGGNSEFKMPEKLTRHSVEKYSFVSVYDLNSYYYRMRLIEREFNRLEKERRKWAVLELVARGLDAYYFDGMLFNVIDGGKIALDALNGKPLEEWGTDLAVFAAESKFIDKLDSREAKAVASMGLALANVCKEARYPHLENAAINALQLISSPKSQKTYHLKDRITFYVRDEVFVSAAYPVYGKYRFLEAEDLKYTGFGDGPAPFDLQLNYWRKDKSAAYFPSLSVMRTPVLYSTNADTIFTSGNALQYLNTSLGLGIVARYSGLTLRLGGYAGMLSETAYTYQIEGDKLLNLKSGETNYFKTFNFNYRAGLSYDFGWVKLMADYAGFLPMKEKDAGGNDIRILKGNFISVGLGVDLMRRWRGYGH